MELESGDGEMTENGNGGFWQKLGLLLIDKLLIGGLIAAAAFYFQARLENHRVSLEAQQAEREHIRDVTLTVSQVFTEIVDADRKTVITAVGSLFAVLNKYESLGQVRDPSDRRRLQKIVEDIENALSQLALVNTDLAVSADSFVKRIRAIRSDLVNKKRGPEDLKRDTQSLLASYTGLLDELRTTSILALEEDRRAVTAMLSRGEQNQATEKE